MPIKNYFNLFSAIFIALSLSACGKGQEQEGVTRALSVRPVKLITVSTVGTAQVSKFPAVIDAYRMSELSLQVGGMLQEFPVTEAQRLNRGDLIAKLDQRDFKSAFVSAKAQFKNAEEEYQRAARLAEQDAIARSVLEQRLAQRDVSRAQLDSAEKALEDSMLTAPYNGVVAQVMVKNLQTISPGQVMVKFISGDLLEATIDLPASFLAQIPKNESANNHRQAFIILDAAPNQIIEATYKEASLLADTTSQTYAITFTFQPPENLMVLPGMNATVELRIQHKAQITRVAVPLDAITSDGKNKYVWAVDKETMTVTKRLVTIENSVGKMVVVTAGLEVNETIAGAGAAYLSEGMKIKEWN